jgi:hypothetical protein
MSFTVANVGVSGVSTGRRAGLGRELLAGTLAGAVGTAAMDGLLYLRYRRAGGRDDAWRWESAAGVTSWATASAPGQVGQKMARLLIRRPPPERWARPATNTVHWATGTLWGLQYALAGTRTTAHPVLRALALGPVAWSASYVLLPLAGVYRPIWQYDRRTLGRDLSAHLVFGTITSAALAAFHRAR